jgi:flagellar biosynthesis protein FliP
MKMNWGNRIENAVLVMIAVLMTFFVMKGIYQPQLKQQQETIVELSKITRYAIQNDFKKVKAKDGTITLDLNNEMNVDDRDATQNNAPADSLKAEERKGFWGRVFGGNK